MTDQQNEKSLKATDKIKTQHNATLRKMKAIATAVWQGIEHGTRNWHLHNINRHHTTAGELKCSSK